MKNLFFQFLTRFSVKCMTLLWMFLDIQHVFSFVWNVKWEKMLSSLYIGRQISQEMNFLYAFDVILTLQNDSWYIFDISNTYTHACNWMKRKYEIFFVFFFIFSDIYILSIINMKVNISLLCKYWSQKKKKIKLSSYEMNIIFIRNTIKIRLMSPFFR